MAVTPSVPSTTNIALGEGKVYFNYGESGQAEVGATRGGSNFVVEREIKEVAYDGAYGPTKGLRRKTKVVPSLKIKALEINYTNLAKYFAGLSSVDSGAYHTITESVDIASGDYLTNVAFVGERLDGKYIICIVKNALGDGNIEFAFEEKEEIVPEVQFTGHYDSSTPTTVPYEIRTED